MLFRRVFSFEGWIKILSCLEFSRHKSQSKMPLGWNSMTAPWRLSWNVRKLLQAIAGFNEVRFMPLASEYSVHTRFSSISLSVVVWSRQFTPALYKNGHRCESTFLPECGSESFWWRMTPVRYVFDIRQAAPPGISHLLWNFPIPVRGKNRSDTIPLTCWGLQIVIYWGLSNLKMAT